MHSNLFFGQRHQVARDMAFALCDAGVLAVAVVRLWRLYQGERVPPSVVRTHLATAAGVVLAALVVYRLVLLL
jgi:hypothetical protein